MEAVKNSDGSIFASNDIFFIKKQNSNDNSNDDSNDDSKTAATPTATMTAIVAARMAASEELSVALQRQRSKGNNSNA